MFGLKVLAARRAEFDERLPALMRRLVDQQLAALRQLEQEVTRIEAELKVVQKNDANARRLRKVPGIGLLGATALAAVLGNASGWRSAREFACALGLTPRHRGTGGKVTMGAINKRGDPYVRTLLVSGARAVANRSASLESARAARIVNSDSSQLSERSERSDRSEFCDATPG